MISHAVARYVRLTPRKIRYVLDIVRGKSVPQAYAILDRTPKRACLVVRKLIMQAAASAHMQHKAAAQDLVVAKIFADGAGMMKRFRSMSMGRAGMIRKRLSHITVELETTKLQTVSASPKAVKPGAKAEAVSAKAKGSKTQPVAKQHARTSKKLAGAR